MNLRRSSQGFTIIELIITSAIFTFVIIGVTQLFSITTNLQRRSTAYQHIEENALYILESIAREVRVSVITSGNTACSPEVALDATTTTLSMIHPVNGTVTYTYTYSPSTGTGVITRSSSTKGGEPEQITSSDVDFSKFAFCVSGSGADNAQVRVTMPATVRARSDTASGTVEISLQVTVASRDLAAELSN